MRITGIVSIELLHYDICTRDIQIKSHSIQQTMNMQYWFPLSLCMSIMYDVYDTGPCYVCSLQQTYRHAYGVMDKHHHWIWFDFGSRSKKKKT